MTIEDHLRIIAQRRDFYLFLSRIFDTEIDNQLLLQIKYITLPTACSNSELCRGYLLLEEYIKNIGDNAVTDLAADYAKVFLGAGMSDYSAAYPYESVYTSAKRIIMQEARDEVVSIYVSKGLQRSDSSDYPEDHIALEMKFMACLCQESGEAAEKGDTAKMRLGYGEQLEFLRKHLLNWAPRFCQEVEKFAETLLYRAAAIITSAFLKMDSSMLLGLIDSIDNPISVN